MGNREIKTLVRKRLQLVKIEELTRLVFVNIK